jgi:hypothetical protein
MIFSSFCISAERENERPGQRKNKQYRNRKSRLEYRIRQPASSTPGLFMKVLKDAGLHLSTSFLDLQTAVFFIPRPAARMANLATGRHYEGEATGVTKFSA